jgi:hypothetical protein
LLLAENNLTLWLKGLFLSLQNTDQSYTSVHHGGTCFICGFENAVLPDVCDLLRMVGNFPA